tara:strand:- start:105 stop:290 length:186 start_codon:yes stop_codon:yes gene_type:complete
MLKDKLDDLKEFLADENTKKEVVDGLNKAVNLPFFNEKTEGKIFDSVYDVFVNAIIKLIGD